MRALSNVRRNVSDDMLLALRENRGVIGINFGEGFVNPKDAAALRSATESESNSPPATGKALDECSVAHIQKLLGPRVAVAATVEDVADHIDHAVLIAGIDCVGIGSDWDGVAGPPNGLEDVSKMPALIAVLLRRGYSESDVKKILGENFLRVIREVIGS